MSPPLRLAGLALLAAYAVPGIANASPAVDGTRNLSLANSSRGSAYGTSAALLSPAHMSLSQQFAIEPLYQLQIAERRHGMGVMVVDSLNNARVAMGLGYIFMRGAPRARYEDVDSGETQTVEMVHFGHEVLVPISVALVKRALAFAGKFKYQYSSLRYRDQDGKARDANDKLNFFGLDLALSANILDFVQVAVVGYNIVGNHPPAWTEGESLQIENRNAAEGTVIPYTVPRLSDYPLGLGHGLAVFPLRKPIFSLNFDGYYDFTSYRHSSLGDDRTTRMVFGGSAEFVAGPVPIRFGSAWDGRGVGSDDDIVLIGGGLGYLKPAPLGGVGIDMGVGFQQEVKGGKNTTIGISLGIRIHPDL